MKKKHIFPLRLFHRISRRQVLYKVKSEELSSLVNCADNGAKMFVRCSFNATEHHVQLTN